MHSEENQWEIEVTKKRFKLDFEVEISLEQAELIYYQDKKVNSAITYFTFWEQVDFETAYLKEILESSQFEKYLIVTAKRLKRFEEDLVKQDVEMVSQLNIVEEKLLYYKEKLLPSLFSDTNLWLIGNFQRSKINFLKAEYKNYLDDRKKEIYLSHVRNSKSFQPNLLKYSLLHHQLNCLFPDYHAFKSRMDEPTKFIKNYLIQQLQHYSFKTDEQLKGILQELREFEAELGKKYLGEVQGWNFSYTHSFEEDKEYRLMCMVLLDRNLYE